MTIPDSLIDLRSNISIATKHLELNVIAHRSVLGSVVIVCGHGQFSIPVLDQGALRIGRYHSEFGMKTVGTGSPGNLLVEIEARYLDLSS